MKAKLVRWTSFAFAALALAGCPEKEDDGDEPKKDKKEAKDEDEDEDKPEPAPDPAPPEPTKLEPDNSTPGIDPKVKAELDNREDGATGTALTIPGGRAVFQLPTGFTSKKNGSFDHAQTSDGKAHFAATQNSGDTNKLVEDGTKALGLAECTWGAAESVTVGKDKVPATAQDGVCKKGSEEVKTFQVIYSGDANTVAIGAWMPGGKMSDVFGVARSIKPVTGGGGPSMAACCAALKQNAASAPPQFKGGYIAAAGVCQSAMTNPQVRSMIRGALGGASMPAACR